MAAARLGPTSSASDGANFTAQVGRRRVNSDGALVRLLLKLAAFYFLEVDLVAAHASEQLLTQDLVGVEVEDEQGTAADANDHDNQARDAPVQAVNH